MAKNIYALLVAIDEYDPTSGVPSLRGCVNDIRAIEAYLRERVAKDSEWTLVEPTDVPWILLNQDATRQGVVKSFQRHLCNADSEDVVFFYYSGHGSQEKAPKEFWSIEPDHLDETLVCYDSRTPGGRDLADKDLAYLISKVNQKDPHTVIILDCCHSGTGTRDLDFSTRRADIDTRERPASTFLFAEDPAELDEMLTSTRSLKETTETLTLPVPKGKYVAFSACRSHQLAKEYKGEDGQQRGAFSYFLLQTLQRTNGNITYRDLARNLNALVSGKVRDQSPQVEATDSEELDRPFLGGAVKPRASYFTLTYSKNDNSWVMDGGALHGIPKSSGGGDTLLAIFPTGSSPEQLRDLNQKLGEAKVLQVLPQRSKVQVELTQGRENLSEDASYWVVVTSLPLNPLKVFLKSDPGQEAGVELALQALQTANDGNPSLFVGRVNDSKEADYSLFARNGQYWITRPVDDRPLVGPIPETPDQTGYTAERALKAVFRLEHIARWTNVLELTSPATSSIKPNDVEMEIILLSGQASSSTSNSPTTKASEMRLEYTYENGEWVPPELKVRLTNRSQKPLYCNVVDLTENFSVDLPFFSEETTSSVLIQPKGDGDGVIDGDYTIKLVVPDELFEQGITETKDIFKLIVSTTDFDGRLLYQEELDLPPPRLPDTRDIPGTLGRLMAQVHSRKAVRSSGGSADDWMTKEIAVTVIRPQNAKSLKSHEKTVLQEGIVQLSPHPSLQAKANLTTVSQATRDVGNMILPAILQQDSSVTQSFQFTTSRGSDPGLTGLELTDVVDYTVVTPEQPLKLLVDAPLAENERVLPVGYDGEFFLPLGRGVGTDDGKTEIQLDRLPSPTVSSRSLQGSIRIFFQKVITKKLGATSAYEYPILASADVQEDEKVVYEKSKELVKGKVASAERIVLFIHGIIGDTESMAPCVRRAKVEVDGQQKTLRELYDLVLTFDYENLQTTIQENAKLLGQRLVEVGLGPNHGKELHIVAHSMGGLVSRWFIEREGGNQVVQHLVMLGTPNAGSPWPAVQDWAFSTLCLGLNQLSVFIWPAKVVAQLLDFIEANDHSLEQMQPGSPILQELATNPDPQIPYTIIAGDRSLVAAATEVQPGKPDSPVQRLMHKAFGRAVDKVVDLTFYAQPNDIAVTLASIKSVSSNRSPQPKFYSPDAACDHLTYFTNPVGLNALILALYPSPRREVPLPESPVVPPIPPADLTTPEPVPVPSADLTTPEPVPVPSADLITPEPVPVSSADPATPEPAPVPSADPATPEPAPVPSAEPVEPPSPIPAIDPSSPQPIAISEPPIQHSDHETDDNEPPSWLNIWIAGVIGFILGGVIVGIVLWRPASQQSPQNGSSQSLPSELRTADVIVSSSFIS